MSKKKMTGKAIAMGAVSLALTGAAVPSHIDGQAQNDRASGAYKVLAAEGKCGEAKCGGSKVKEGKCSSGKKSDGKVKEGKCGESKCGADKSKRDSNCRSKGGS